MNEHQALQSVFYFIEFVKDWILGTEREEMEEQGELFFTP